MSIKNNQLTPGERYHRDAEFAQLVNLMEAFIHRCQFTPTELREAAILAAIRYYTVNPPPIFTRDMDMTIRQMFEQIESRDKQL